MKYEVGKRKVSLKKMNFEKVSEIYMIGYTLNKDKNSYSEAIIIYDDETSVITDDHSLIVQYLILYAEQHNLILNELSKDSHVYQLIGQSEQQFKKIFEKIRYYDDLKKMKLDSLERIYALGIVDLISYVLLNSEHNFNSSIVYSTVMLISSILMGILLVDYKNNTLIDIQNRLNELIRTFSKDLIDNHEKVLELSL